MSGSLAAAVFDPVRSELFTASRGGGARLGEQRLVVGDKPDLASALVATGFGYDAAQRITQSRILAKVMGEVRDIRRFGSAALDLCWIAAKRYDAYLSRRETPGMDGRGDGRQRRAAAARSLRQRIPTSEHHASGAAATTASSRCSIGRRGNRAAPVKRFVRS